MDFIDKVIMHLALIDWQTVLIYLGSASVIVPVTNYLKGKLNNKTKQKVFAIVGVFSALPQVVETIVNNPQLAQYLPDQFGWLFSTVVLLHAFFASPLWRRLNSTLQQYKQALEVVRSTDSSQPVAPMTNPNLTLNTPAPAQPPVEQEPLRIQ